MTNDPLILDEPGEWAGLWWLPDEPDGQVPGILRYDPEEGLVLSLIGTFEDRVMTMHAPGVVSVHEGRRTWDVIYGAAERREITLLGCVPTKSNRTYGARVKSPDKQIVQAGKALIGAHVGGEDKAAFSSAEVSVEDLTHWAASSALTRSWGISDGISDGRGKISVEPVETQSVQVDGTEFRLAHRHTLPFFEQLRGGTEGRMRDTAFVRIVPPEAFSLNDAISSASLVQDLISLATHRAAGAIWLRLELVQEGSAPPANQLVPRRNVDVLYFPPAIGKPATKAIDHHRAFFTCASLPFEEVFPRWLEAYGRLQAATNMILGLRYAPARFIESNLLTAVGAAEVLHRGLGIDEKPIPADEFKPMREAMLTQVPKKYRERFRATLRNDPTLRDRLYALAARPDQEAISMLVPDVDRWARRTTQARNDLAHEGKTPRHSLDELMAIVDVTTAVVILNVLNELELPADRQREIVREHPELRNTAERAQNWLATPPPEDRET